ncbi:MAG: hypothetical protein V7711_01465 [Pseudomonadales bacterium]
MAAKEFPWYDSPWLEAYHRARRILEEVAPGKIADLESLLAPLRTSSEFTVRSLPKFLDQDIIAEFSEIIAELKQEQLERHEVFRFGRMVVHGHPRFTKFQCELTSRVSDAVGEEVEPSYNFLSLYNNLGVCEPHLDAPFAKWTLDMCISQSDIWPIYIAQVAPWPQPSDISKKEWQSEIKNGQQHQFEKYELNTGDAIIFGGSSQWHYRERIPRASKDNFCHLLFLHYVPLGASKILDPASWASTLAVPELDKLSSLTPSD